MLRNHVLVLMILLSSFILKESNKAMAQENEQPAVQVNMDVLNAINPAHSTYSKPVNTSRKRFLTQPSNNGAPYKPQNYNTNAGNISKHIPLEENSKPVLKPAKTSTAVSFPIDVKDRTEVYDPSVNVTPEYDGEPIINTKKEPQKAVPTPIPTLKPIKTALPAKKSSYPVPPSTPEKKSMAKEIAENVKIVRVPAEPLSIENDGDQAMPAVPAKRVFAEPLKPPPGIAYESDHIAKSDNYINDQLAQSLVTPNKEAMVDSIEAVTKLAQALMPVVPNTTRTEPSPLKKNTAFNKIPLPKKKPSQENNIIARIDEAVELASISPAAGYDESQNITEYIGVPREPPTSVETEKEYITLPFNEGDTELDGDVRTNLADNILPLLKQNPSWRLQIQAFASTTEDQLGNARRTSLSRGLAVRTYLLDQGIEARRMDVRALGMQTDREPADRVDFVFFDPNIMN